MSDFIAMERVNGIQAGFFNILFVIYHALGSRCPPRDDVNAATDVISPRPLRTELQHRTRRRYKGAPLSAMSRIPTMQYGHGRSMLDTALATVLEWCPTEQTMPCLPVLFLQVVIGPFAYNQGGACFYEVNEILRKVGFYLYEI